MIVGNVGIMMVWLVVVISILNISVVKIMLCCIGLSSGLLVWIVVGVVVGVVGFVIFVFLLLFELMLEFISGVWSGIGEFLSGY